LRVLRLVDTTRATPLPDGSVTRRTLITYVRYPADAASGTDLPGAAPARGRYLLVVMAHGFTLEPSTYTALLRAWARAGYVVAAPVLPLTNTNAPGGANRADLINQPADLRFVITRLTSTLRGIVDPTRIAVAGHSDGGDSALAIAYDPRFRDARVGAAVILSGSPVAAFGGFAPARRSPPLLAAQGTADQLNPPSASTALFSAAPRPKYLLRLIGAGHQAPYQDEQPYLGVVERVSVAFLDRYLKGRADVTLEHAGNVPGVAAVDARP
jgi:predicted dienelactone hydrolase